MGKDAAVLVVPDEQSCAGPQPRILFDRVVHRRDEGFSRLHVVIRVLVGGQFLAVISVVVVVVWFDKAIVRQGTDFAVGQELFIRGKQLGLVLQQVHDFHRGTGLVVIVNLRRVGGISGDHALIDALIRLL